MNINIWRNASENSFKYRLDLFRASDSSLTITITNRMNQLKMTPELTADFSTFRRGKMYSAYFLSNLRWTGWFDIEEEGEPRINRLTQSYFQANDIFNGAPHVQIFVPSDESAPYEMVFQRCVVCRGAVGDTDMTESEYTRAVSPYALLADKYEEFSLLRRHIINKTEHSVRLMKLDTLFYQNCLLETLMKALHVVLEHQPELHEEVIRSVPNFENFGNFVREWSFYDLLGSDWLDLVSDAMTGDREIISSYFRREKEIGAVSGDK